MRVPREFILGVLFCGLLVAGCAPKPARPGVITARPDATEIISIDYPTTDLTKILKEVAVHFHLKLDGPHDLHGQTSLRLRDVTWQQIFRVTLTPVGYDFYERDGVVVIRPKETVDALPDETRVTALRHQSVAETIEYLNRFYAGSAAFSPAENSVVYRAHPRRLSHIAAEIDRIDRPEVALKRFPRKPHLPERLPALEPIPLTDLGYPPDWSVALSDTLTTEIFTLEHIDAFLVKPYLDRETSASRGDRVLPDVRINALVVTAPEFALPRLAAMVAYLDDKRWYDPGNIQAQDAAFREKPENPPAKPPAP